MASKGERPETPQALMKAKLLSSGLRPELAGKMGMTLLSAEKTAALGDEFKRYPSLRIGYFDINNKPTGFYRIRYLGEMEGLDALAGKPQRYAQPRDTDPEVYWPNAVPWKDISANLAEPVYITEGELKACKGCADGFATIGLGGVWSWRSKKKGVGLVRDIAEFGWKGREVRLVFDSDFRTNPDVMRALVALSRALLSKGARPFLVTLPEGKGNMKQGLDDFLVAEGPEDFKALAEEAEPFAMAEELWRLNTEVVYIRDPGLIVVFDDKDGNRKITASSFKEHAYSNRFFEQTTFDAKGNARLEKKPAAPAWLQWEHRAELARLTYAPGQPTVTKEGALNEWPGWGCEPKKGDVSFWKKLLDFIFGDDAVGRKWFEQWCAWPLQNPGGKMYSAAVIWGVAQGTGKSLIGYSLVEIYGKNGTEIDDQDMEATYNEWAENKQFAMGDDVMGAEHRRRNTERLKTMITRRELRLNPKYIPSYTVPDCINYYFTSQHPDAFFVEDKDRRYFVHEAPPVPMERAWYNKYVDWLRGPANGKAALFHYLLRLDLTGFDPHGPPPATAAKLAMVADSKSDVGAWCTRLAEDPDSVLRLGDMKMSGDLFNAEQLLRLYDPDASKKLTANGMSREMKRAGFRHIYKGMPVSTVKGQMRLYAVRNIERWLTAKGAECAAHWNEHFGKGAKAEKKSKGEKF